MVTNNRLTVPSQVTMKTENVLCDTSTVSGRYVMLDFEDDRKTP